MKFDIDYAWTGSQPVATGVIREQLSDFQVSETLPFVPDGDGEHAYLRVRKQGNNTGWVGAQIAAFAGVKDVDVSFAGRKDRWAITEQWYSCYLPGQPDPDWNSLAVDGVEVVEATRHRSKLRRGDLSGNRFKLVVRHLAGDHGEIDTALARVRTDGFPNYFGPQRFGRDNGNLVLADRLMNGERLTRNRNMIVSVARSYLFNRYLSDMINQHGWSGVDALEPGQLFGRSRDPQPGEDRLDEDGQAWVAGLRRLKIGIQERALRVIPVDLNWSFAGDSLELAFGLPPGSYATSLLREVVSFTEAVHTSPAEVDSRGEKAVG